MAGACGLGHRQAQGHCEKRRAVTGLGGGGQARRPHGEPPKQPPPTLEGKEGAKIKGVVGVGVSGGTQLILPLKLETVSIHVGLWLCASVGVPSGTCVHAGMSSGSRRPALSAYVQVRQCHLLPFPANFCPLIFLGLVD